MWRRQIAWNQPFWRRATALPGILFSAQSAAKLPLCRFGFGRSRDFPTLLWSIVLTPIPCRLSLFSMGRGTSGPFLVRLRLLDVAWRMAVLVLSPFPSRRPGRPILRRVPHPSRFLCGVGGQDSASTPVGAHEYLASKPFSQRPTNRKRNGQRANLPGPVSKQSRRVWPSPAIALVKTRRTVLIY